MPDPGAVPGPAWGLALLSGALLALSFPRPALGPLAWVAFVPLLLAIGKRTPGQSFKLGVAAGGIAYGGILYWVNIVMTHYGKLPWLASFALYLLLAGYLALYLGGVAFLTRRAEAAGISPLLAFPVCWVGLEYLRSFVLTGFPWASLGYTQFRFPALIQVADLVGVYGLSFLVAFANVVAYRILGSLVRRERRRFPLPAVVVLLLLLAATLGYGIHRLRAPETGDPLRVVLVQGNIPQDVKWDPTFQEATVKTYEDLSRRACVTGADLVVWPESALPFYFQREEPYAGRVRGLARELKSCLVVGSPAYEQEGAKVRYLNSAFLLNAAGTLVGRSDKLHLVPFGEYVPLGRFLPFVNKLVTGIGDFSPGAAATPLDTGKAKIGVLVCFEAIFPEISRAYVRAGCQVLVNITNDAWFGRSSAPWQHLSMAAFRAVENRVPLVRAANTGISSFIDSHGRIRETTGLFQEAFLAGEVRIGGGETFYCRHGDLLAGACLALTALLGVLSLRRRDRS